MKRQLALLLVLACALPASAHANGDPASDVLPFSNVFASVQRPKTFAEGRTLLELTAAAQKKKYPIKVAVIAASTDLGLVQSMWKKPQPYARFLGQELLSFANYHGTLVVAMPQGFGVFGPGASARGKSALATLPKPGGSDLRELAKAAGAAVRKVAAANGRTLPAANEGSGTPAWLIVLAVIGGALLIIGAVFVALRGWLTHP